MEFSNSSIAAGTLYGISGSTRMSFIEYHYPLLQELHDWSDYHIQLAGLDDLACMKLAAIAQRGLRKDFIDIYIMVKEYKPLGELLSLYKKKYQTENYIPVLMGMVYFQNAEQEPDPPLWSEKWSEVKRTLSSWVKELS
ncbi:MAG: nucleotidyl transferase AbiEii/AbiGii toxin family protein [Anaerolineaceae bacterium]